MKTFLSVLSIKTNNFSNEKIVIGLLAVSANEVFYAYSKEKLKLLNKLSNQESLSSYAETFLSQVKKKVSKTNNDKSKHQESFKFGKSLFTEEYFKYLSDYNNGVLNFSEPFEINYNFSELDFEKYYNNFVGESLNTKTSKQSKSFHKKIKPYFKKEGLDTKADINYTLNPLSFKGILKDSQIPLITKNGNINALQEIDFEMLPSTITNNLYETKIIFDALGKFATDINTSLEKIKIAFEEPDLNTEQHKLFDLAIKEYNQSFEFITLDKVDSFTDTIINSEYVKFSSLIK